MGFLRCFNKHNFIMNLSWVWLVFFFNKDRFIMNLLWHCLSFLNKKKKKQFIMSLLWDCLGLLEKGLVLDWLSSYEL